MPAETAGADGGFDKRFFAVLAELEEKNFWFRARNRIILWALKRRFPDMRSFLEAGCGTGYVLSAVGAAFPGARVCGADMHEEGLGVARTRIPRAELVKADVREIGFEGEFDVAGAFDVIEHVPEDEAALARLHRAVRPGGGIILTVPQHPELWSRFDEFSGHVRRYRRAELREKLTKNGFRVCDEVSFVSILLPLLRAKRARPAGPDYDGMAELRVSPLVDKAGQAVMSLERFLIRAGARFAAGGSLLVTAVKERA